MFSIGLFLMPQSFPTGDFGWFKFLWCPFVHSCGQRCEWYPLQNIDERNNLDENTETFFSCFFSSKSAGIDGTFKRKVVFVSFLII